MGKIEQNKLRQVINKRLSSSELLIEKLIITNISGGIYAYLNESIYNESSSNFLGIFTDAQGSNPYSGTYTIDYTSAVITFTTAPTQTLYAKYYGGGSIIWADDVNNLNDAVKIIDNNTLYSDGSTVVEGNLNINGHDLQNVRYINNVVVQSHKHLGSIESGGDGTEQLGDSSISSLSISKIDGLQSTLNDLQSSINSKQNKLPTYQSGKFLTNDGTNLSWGYPYTRNIGELVKSILPLNDSRLSLLNGSVLSGNTYTDLYNYLLDNSTITTYSDGINIVGNLQNTDYVLSGFTASDYAQIPFTFGYIEQPNESGWQVKMKFKYVQPTATGFTHQCIISSEVSRDNKYGSELFIETNNINNVKWEYLYLNIFVTFPDSIGTVTQWKQLKIDTNPTTNPSLSRHFFENGKDYWVRYGYSKVNSSLDLEVSDNASFTGGSNHVIHVSTNISSNSQFPVLEKSFFNIGIDHELNHIFLGEIDLNDSSISIYHSGIGYDTIWQVGNPLYYINSNFIIEDIIWRSYNYIYDNCGKFVLDLTNETIRLPKISSILQGVSTSQDVGNLIEAGLPNIKGQDGMGWSQQYLGIVNNGNFRYGALTGTQVSSTASGPNSYVSNTASGISVPNVPLGVSFDASKGEVHNNVFKNIVYGKSDTVQPQTVQVLYYMVVSK